MVCANYLVLSATPWNKDNAASMHHFGNRYTERLIYHSVNPITMGRDESFEFPSSHILA
jgi:hypothetical protein